MKRQKLRKISFFISISSYLGAILLFLFCQKFEMIDSSFLSIANFLFVIGIVSASIINFTLLFHRSKPLSKKDIEELLEIIHQK
ncbi:MAG: hypothetical protein ACI4F9_07575 [Lachnospiraceae bacterium]